VGVYSNGPLGVAGGKRLVCGACVTASDLANRIVLNYNLAPGANSAAVTLPTSVPVQVMGVQTALGYRGVASATMLHIAGSFLEWTGLESTAGLPSPRASVPHRERTSCTSTSRIRSTSV
jgi:hypothetical protein